MTKKQATYALQLSLGILVSIAIIGALSSNRRVLAHEEHAQVANPPPPDWFVVGTPYSRFGGSLDDAGDVNGDGTTIS